MRSFHGKKSLRVQAELAESQRKKEESSNSPDGPPRLNDSGPYIPHPTKTSEWKAKAGNQKRKANDEKFNMVMWGVEKQTCWEFKQALYKRNGNMVRAWRNELDPTNHGSLGWLQFVMALKRINFRGDVGSSG